MTLLNEKSLRACPAPAKLNLFLHVTGRRADGYHLLQSVFQLVERCDSLDFSLRDDGNIVRTNDIPGVPAETDLVVRAARLLKDAAEARLGRALPGTDITLHKILPMGGGLGGGSSDAATTMLALNRLWQAGFTRAELMQLGLALGADVPFFLFGRNAFAEGVGEELQAVETPQRWFVVLEPGVAVPTVQIFNSSQLTRNSKPVKITDFSAAPGIFNFGFGKNDLQGVAAALYPEIADVIEWLSRYGEARMTGSGASVFGVFDNEAQADAVLAEVPARWKAWKARALAFHPMEL